MIVDMEHLFSPEHEASSTAYSGVEGVNSLADSELNELFTNPEVAGAESNGGRKLTRLLEIEAACLRRDTWVSFASSGAFLVALLWIVRYTNMTENVLKSNMLLWFLVMLGISGGVCASFIKPYYRRKKNFTATLAENYSIEEIAPLIRTIKAQNTSVSALAKKKLTELLPAVKASDSGSIGVEERKILMRQLCIPPNDPGYRDPMELFSKEAYKRELEFRLSILKALEQIGGMQEVEAVERVARGQISALSASKFPDEIRKAAQDCLPYLKARSEEQRDASQLLRASSVNDLSGDALLRPASSPSETGSELLLRASNPPI